MQILWEINPRGGETKQNIHDRVTKYSNFTTNRKNILIIISRSDRTEIKTEFRRLSSQSSSASATTHISG